MENNNNDKKKESDIQFLLSLSNQEKTKTDDKNPTPFMTATEHRHRNVTGLLKLIANEITKTQETRVIVRAPFTVDGYCISIVKIASESAEWNANFDVGTNSFILTYAKDEQLKKINPFPWNV